MEIKELLKLYRDWKEVIVVPTISGVLHYENSITLTHSLVRHNLVKKKIMNLKVHAFTIVDGILNIIILFEKSEYENYEEGDTDDE